MTLLAACVWSCAVHVADLVWSTNTLNRRLKRHDSATEMAVKTKSYFAINLGLLSFYLVLAWCIAVRTRLFSHTIPIIYGCTSNIYYRVPSTRYVVTVFCKSYICKTALLTTRRRQLFRLLQVGRSSKRVSPRVANRFVSFKLYTINFDCVHKMYTSHIYYDRNGHFLFFVIRLHTANMSLSDILFFSKFISNKVSYYFIIHLSLVNIFIVNGLFPLLYTNIGFWRIFQI